MQQFIKDPTFLIAADNDERFLYVKQEKEQLKIDLRDEQRQVVEHLMQKINSFKQNFKSANIVAEDVGITDFTVFRENLASLDNKIAEINKLYMRDSYFDLLKAKQVTHDAYDRSLKAYEKHIAGWIKFGSTSLDNLKAKVNEIEEKGTCGWGFLITVIVGILSYLILDNTFLGEPKKSGPARVLTFTKDVTLNAKYSPKFKKGESAEVVSETDDLICLSLIQYEKCFNRQKILKVSKLEIGYFIDYRRMLSVKV
jgi:hypothetical protein